MDQLALVSVATPMSPITAAGPVQADSRQASGRQRKVLQGAWSDLHGVGASAPRRCGCGEARQSVTRLHRSLPRCFEAVVNECPMDENLAGNWRLATLSSFVRAQTASALSTDCAFGMLRRAMPKCSRVAQQTPLQVGGLATLAHQGLPRVRDTSRRRIMALGARWERHVPRRGGSDTCRPLQEGFDRCRSRPCLLSTMCPRTSPCSVSCCATSTPCARPTPAPPRCTWRT